MNEQTALNLIEAYFVNKATETDYEVAPDYFLSSPRPQLGLSKFYQELLADLPFIRRVAKMKLSWINPKKVFLFR